MDILSAPYQHTLARREVSGYSWNWSCATSRIKATKKWKMSYFTQLTFALPDDCSFKGHFCSWINDNNDDFDWLINSGDTMTQNTGPTSDADGDGEYEIFFLCGERALRSFPKKNYLGLVSCWSVIWGMTLGLGFSLLPNLKPKWLDNFNQMIRFQSYSWCNRLPSVRLNRAHS